MRITLDVPEEIAAHLQAGGGDLSQAAIEALALEGYRTKKLSSGQVRRLLGLATRMQVHSFLKQHDVYLHYGAAEMEQDRQFVEAFLKVAR